MGVRRVLIGLVGYSKKKIVNASLYQPICWQNPYRSSAKKNPVNDLFFITKAKKKKNSRRLHNGKLFHI